MEIKKNAWCIFICNKNNFVKIIVLMDVKKNLIFDCSIISELKRKKNKKKEIKDNNEKIIHF